MYWNVFVVDIIHQSGTVNYKIILDKIVDIFPNKSIYFSVFLNAIYLLCYNISVCNNELHK